MATASYDGFTASVKDTDRLFAFYDRERLAQSPRVPEEIEVFKRAALLLLVTAWETYIEDLLRERFLPRLAAATEPSSVQRAFNTVAGQWAATANAKSIQDSLAQWTGIGWQTKIKDYFEAQIATLNTPNSKNCARLFKTFLEVDTKSLWVWVGYNAETAMKRLDDIVTLRGKVAHVARRAGTTPTKHPVSRNELERAIKFMKELVIATDKL